MTHATLQKFLDAQQNTYEQALSELKNGKKRSHWMWFIFPQIAGLGMTETSKYYAIKNISEAGDYLKHPVLGQRLSNICQVLLQLNTCDPTQIFGTPDDLKLRSSMTLFGSVPSAPAVFEEVLAKFYNGEKDKRTLALLNA